MGNFCSSAEECKTMFTLIEESECKRPAGSDGGATSAGASDGAGAGTDTDIFCVGNLQGTCAEAPHNTCSQNYTSIGGLGLQCVPDSVANPRACNAYNDSPNNIKICIPPIRDCNGNSVSSCSSIGNNSPLCSQSYSPSGTPGYAIQCIPSSNGDACNYWNNGSTYQNAEICRIPQ